MSQSLPALDATPSGLRDPRLAGAAIAVAPLRVWILVFVGALALGVYANSLVNGFAYDDIAIVQENPHVVSLEWTTIWSDSYWPRVNGMLPDVLYRPLTLWSYLANQSLTPGVAWPFHLANIVLHALVSVLVSVLAWRILGNRWVALLAGVLFAVHPIHTEAVANTVGRAEVLAALWSLLALLVYLPPTPLSANAAPVRRPWWHGLIVAACFLAALLCKETPVTLLLALALLDGWRWWRWSKESRPAWLRWFTGQALRYYLPLMVALGFYLKLRMAAGGLMNDTKRIHPVVNSLAAASPLERVVTPFTLLAKYLWITFWPSHLSADYSAPSLMPTANPLFANAFQPPAAAGILVLALALLAAVRLRRKAPAFLLLLGLFAASYLLVANVLRIGTIFGERLFYWPSVFVLIMVAWALVAGYGRMGAAYPGMRRRAAVLGVLVLVAVPVAQMACLTWRRNTDWSDNVALAISTARDNPGSAKACSWAGSVLVMADRPEFVTFGKSLIERAIDLSPNFGQARWELAKYYGVRHDMAYSAIWIAEAARLDPGSRMSCEAIPALIAEMRTFPPESYMPEIEAYERDHPDDPAAQLALAFGWHAQQDFEQAAASARKAIDMARHVRMDGFDQFHEAGAELARIWFDRGWVEQAVDKYRLYVTYMGQSMEAHYTFATMLMALDAQTHPQALSEAEANLAKGAEIDPGNTKIRDLRGQIQRRRRDLAQGTPVTPNAGGNPEVAHSALEGDP
jgi:protein O-mannosyl-transferase